MEQATNTFNKGLLIDTNPMILDNDTLTDCLNGTLITMNGNEIILLNDMGNRRVDNAYLPSGYEPVGIKEYGGIIYIAAYNPITNKSLIGSFPSPLLKYGKSDGLSATIDDNLFDQYFEDYNFPGIHFLKNFIILTSFIDSSKKKIILHAGDKFTIYGGGLNSNEITNYNNVNNSGTKLNSPKNKKYTLSLGVLNSLNEFVDFTKSLLRWDSNNKIITFNENDPDYIKFNTGYFIPKNYSEPNLNYTKLDLEFINNRLKVSANTYAYKLIGPLYIKKELNIVLNLTYNVYGNFYIDSLKNKNVEVFIETIYEYNCPDTNINTNYITNTSTDKYDSLELVEKNSELFILGSIIKYKYRLDNLDDDSDWSNLNNEKLIENTTYNNETNLYKAIKYANLLLENRTTGYLDLMIVPKSGQNSLGIRNLSYLDSIDISKLNSNEIELTNFRFYTNLDKNITDITIGFKAYPKYRTSFKDLKISIYNYDYDGLLDISPIKVFDWGESGYNGIKTFTWDWVDDLKSHFYPVIISYSIDNELDDDSSNISNNELDDDSSNISNNKEIKRWIMTTKLLNDCYYSSSLNFVKDYGKYEDGQFDLIIENKLNVQISSNITNLSDVEKSYIYKSGDLCIYRANIIEQNGTIGDYTVTSSLNNDSESDNAFKSTITKIYDEDININGQFYLDRNLYPIELEISSLSIFDNLGNEENVFDEENNENNNEEIIIHELANITKDGISANFEEDYLFDSNTTFPKTYLNLDTYNVNLNFNIKVNKLNFIVNYHTNLIGEEIYYNNSVRSIDIVIEKLFTSFYKYMNDNTIRPYAAISVFSNEYNNSHCIYFSHQEDKNKKIGELDNVVNYKTPYPTAIIANHSGSRILENDEDNNYSFTFEQEKEYINKAIDSYFGNKLCFVGTNNNWISNYKTFYSEFEDDEDDPTKVDEKYVPCRPIMFWMKTLDGWAMLPLGKWLSNHTAVAGEGIINDDHNFNMVLGFLGQKLDYNRYSNYFDDDKIEAYIRMRIKNFYYVGEQNIVKTVYSIDPGNTPIIEHNIGTINIDLNLNVKLNKLSESNSIKYICQEYDMEENDTFFKNNNSPINISIFSKDVVFKETEEFSNLLESFKELLKTNTIKTALEEYDVEDHYNKASSSCTLSDPFTYVSSNYTLTLHFSDKNGNTFNSDLMYVKDNNTEKYLYIPNISVQYNGFLPLVKQEYEDCGIDFMYCTEDNSYYEDNEDSTHLYMTNVPTIPRILLKN